MAAAAAAFWAATDASRALWIAVAVLVVTCPCALSLATPTALAVAVGAWNELVDLLQEDEVRLVVADDRRDPPESVPPVHAADHLVDVPGEKAQGRRRGRIRGRTVHRPTGVEG